MLSDKLQETSEVKLHHRALRINPSIDANNVAGANSTLESPLLMNMDSSRVSRIYHEYEEMLVCNCGGNCGR